MFLLFWQFIIQFEENAINNIGERCQKKKCTVGRYSINEIIETSNYLVLKHKALFQENNYAVIGTYDERQIFFGL